MELWADRWEAACLLDGLKVSGINIQKDSMVVLPKDL